jgi:transcriptional regulator with XRE-family HTH domain
MIAALSRVGLSLNDIEPAPQDPAACHPGRSLAEKTEWLIRHMWPPGMPPARTNADIVAAIKAATGEDMSHTVIWKLRTGKGDNPTLKTLTALSNFFKVPMSYFGEGEEAESVGDQVALLALLRDSGVSRTALRSLVDLSGESRQMITEMIESAARMEQRRSGDVD